MTYFDAEQFCNDHRIKTYGENAKNVPKGGLGVQCPFCGDKSNHLHFYLGTWGAKCWRCGKKKITEVVAALLRINTVEANKIIPKYVKGDRGRKVVEIPTARNVPDQLKFPAGTGPMKNIHRNYLIRRNFDPYELERMWGLLGTNHLDPHYKMRIILPFFYKGEVVTYQARDITDKQIPKYRACPPEDELIGHKNLVYGMQAAIGDSVVIVEGATDVWRLGPGAVAIMGASFKPAQLSLIAKTWKRIFILLDPDEAGACGGLDLFYMLSAFNPDVKLMQLEGGMDPGDLSDSDARYLMERQLKVR